MPKLVSSYVLAFLEQVQPHSPPRRIDSRLGRPPQHPDPRWQLGRWRRHQPRRRLGWRYHQLARSWSNCRSDSCESVVSFRGEFALIFGAGRQFSRYVPIPSQLDSGMPWNGRSQRLAWITYVFIQYVLSSFQQPVLTLCVRSLRRRLHPLWRLVLHRRQSAMRLWHPRAPTTIARPTGRSR